MEKFVLQVFYGKSPPIRYKVVIGEQMHFDIFNYSFFFFLFFMCWANISKRNEDLNTRSEIVRFQFALVFVMAGFFFHVFSSFA